MKEKEIEIVNEYDGYVGFDVPILISNDENETIPIYGLLYNRERRHRDDLWTWELNRYICYLQGCENVQKNGGKLVPEQWITCEGNIIALDVNSKNFVYQTMRHRMIGYRIFEDVLPYEFGDEDVDDIFVLSPDFLIKNGLTPVITIIDVE